MRKILLILVLGLVLALAVFAKHEKGKLVSHTFPNGFSMITLPYEPINSSVKAVFGDYPISGNLHRYNTSMQGYVTYYDFIPSKFGNMVAGEGYWFYCIYENCTIEYGAEKKDVLVTKLLEPGWYMVGDSMENWSARWYYNKDRTTIIMHKHKTIFKEK